MISSKLLLVRSLFILLLHSVLLVSNGSAWVAENKDNRIPVPNPQNGTLNLEFYLCDSEGQGKLRPGTILSLDPSVTHHISLSGGFCVLRNMSNLTVMSGNDTLYANISCSVTSPDVFSIQTARGFAFLGGSHVKIQRINLMQCGGPLSSSFFHNDSSLPAYFGLYQSVALFFTHTFNLSLINVTISEYYGFAIAAINPLGDTLFEGIEIHNALSHNLPVCTQDTHIRGNYSCYGSGLLIYNHDGCLIKSKICPMNQNNVTIKRCHFYNNINLLFDYVCILNLFQFQPSRIPIVSGPALTVYTTQHSFNSSISLINSTVFGNRGLILGGILFIFIDTPFSSSVILNGVNFSNNSLLNFCVGTGLVTYVYQGHIFPRNLTELYQKIFYFPESTIDKQMTSIPVTICKCNESSHEPDCTERFETYEMYPGQSLSVYIVVLDENNVPVQSQVNAFFSYDRSLVPLPGWNLVSEQEITTFIGRSCQKFNYTILSDLKITEGHLNLAVPGKPSYIYVPIKLKKCPPGLILKNDRCQCGAFVSNPNFGLTCNSNEMTVTKGANAWVGIVTQGNKSVIGYSKYCPNEYCSTTSNVLHINDSNSTVCLNNREGVLCGNCKSGYSAAHGGPECKVCSNNGLFWLIGNVSAGFILVFLLFLFKLTLNVGTIGGLIFYANVFAITNTIPINQSYNIPLVQLIQLLNMHQAFAACLYSGMHYYMNLYMNFCYSLYLWLIAGFIIFLAHYSTKVANLLMGSSVQVLMTLIHLSLAKILVSSIDAFLFARVHTESADPYTVWLYNGSIHYGTGMHIPLLITASLFTSIVIVPYVGLALFGWTCLRFSCINKFRPFFDTIYGPYKDSYRYWFGLRLVLLVFIAISTAGEFTFYQYLLQIVLLVVFTIFQAYLKPFKKSWANILDTWCMLNVLVLVCINMYRIYQDFYSEYILFASLISICSTILGILLYHVLKTFRHWFVFCKNKRAGVQMLNNSTPEVEEHETNSNQQFHEPLLQVNSNQFREPLLGYMDSD